MAAEISPEELEQLFELARQKSREGRAELYRNVASLFEGADDRLADRERALMTDIMRRLSHEVEMAVRRRLADQIAKNPQAPHELVVLLANDRIEVAYPILVESEVLRDADLVEVVQHRTFQHRMAVAMRTGLSEPVTDALVKGGEPDVIVQLLTNTDARISADALAHLVQESERIDRYQNPLLRRGDLPKELALRMLAWVSAALREYVIDHFDVDVHELDDALSAVVDDARWDDQNGTDEDGPSRRLVEKLFAAGELTPSFLLKSLNRGEVLMFELAFARLTGLRATLMRRILYEPGGEGLAMACRAIGIDRSVFMTLFRLTRQARGEPATLEDTQIDKVNDLFETLRRDSALLVLRHWSRDPGYLDAVRRIEAKRAH